MCLLSFFIIVLFLQIFLQFFLIRSLYRNEINFYFRNLLLHVAFKSITFITILIAYVNYVEKRIIDVMFAINMMVPSFLIICVDVRPILSLFFYFVFVN